MNESVSAQKTADTTSAPRAANVPKKLFSGGYVLASGHGWVRNDSPLAEAALREITIRSAGYTLAALDDPFE